MPGSTSSSFRRRNPFASFVLFLPYSALAIALFVQLLILEPLAAMIFGPYLLYFIYATAWGYQVWRLNQEADPSQG
jgi:tryptophan-rich sensory protein